MLSFTLVILKDPTLLDSIADYTAQKITWPAQNNNCLLYTSPSPRDRQKSRMPSSA